MLRAYLERFSGDESGAVTVDWVAIAGAMVGLGVLVVLDVIQDATDAASAVGVGLSQAGVIDITFLVTPGQQATATGTSFPGPVGP